MPLRNINQSMFDSASGQESRQAGCTHSTSPKHFWAPGLPALKTFIAQDCDSRDGEVL